MTVKLDRLAIGLSALCLLHCLAIPVAIVLLPVIGQTLFETETWVHWLLLAFAVPVSVFALTSGYQQSQNGKAAILGTLGLVLMFFGVSHLLGDGFEVPLTLVGVVAVSAAHLMNMRARLLVQSSRTSLTST